MNARRKKEKKGKKAKLIEEQQAQYDALVEEELASIPRPTWLDLIPCRIVLAVVALVKGIVSFTVNFPSLIREMQEERKRRQEEAQREEQEEEDTDEGGWHSVLAFQSVWSRATGITLNDIPDSP